MKTSKKILMIVFLAIAVLLAGFMVFALATGFNIGDFDLVFLGTGGPTVTDEYTIEDIVDSIDVNWGSSNIHLLSHDNDEIYMKHTRSKKTSPIEYSVHNNQLNISIKRPFFVFFAFNVRSTLDVYLPKKEYEKIKIKLGSGEAELADIKVKNVELNIASGDVSARELICDDAVIKISSGEINFFNINASENLELKVASGNINGRELSANLLNMEVSSGEVKLDGKFDNVKFKVSSGDVTLSNEVAPKSMEGGVSSGRVDIYIPENDGFNLNCSKTSGSFKSDFDLMRSINNNLYSYKNGGNDGIVYNLKITSGDIRLKQTT